MRAEGHYAAAAEAISACPRGTMRPVAVILHIYRTLLCELLERGWRRLDEPVGIAHSGGVARATGRRGVGRGKSAPVRRAASREPCRPSGQLCDGVGRACRRMPRACKAG